LPVIALPNAEEGDIAALTAEFGTSDFLVVESDVDFVGLVDDAGTNRLYYVVQLPGLSLTVDDGGRAIPFIIYQMRGVARLVIHVQVQDDIAVLEKFFPDSIFIASWQGMLVSFLEPVTAQVENYVVHYYRGNA
jgi:hypothetical protein